MNFKGKWKFHISQGNFIGFLTALIVGWFAWPWAMSQWMTYVAATNPIVVAPWVGSILGVLPIGLDMEIVNYEINDKSIFKIDLGSGGFVAIITWLIFLFL